MVFRKNNATQGSTYWEVEPLADVFGYEVVKILDNPRL